MTGYRVAPMRQRIRRNGFPIHLYSGANGGGKTMCAVLDSLPSLAAGRPIVSTCRILDPATGEPHPLWVPMDDFRVLLELSYCDVILDEISGFADSRDAASLPTVVLNHLQQLRKGDVTVRITTPDWNRADVGIRRVVQGHTTCQGVVKSEQVVVSEDGLERRWKQRRGAIWRTYDAKHFDDWTKAKERSGSKAHRLRPIAKQVVWFSWLHARDFYDTYEHALAPGLTDGAGMCLTCGGKRRARMCACDPETPAKDPSPGMLRWRELDGARRVLEVPETDETPGVLIEEPELV